MLIPGLCFMPEKKRIIGAAIRVMWKVSAVRFSCFPCVNPNPDIVMNCQDLQHVEANVSETDFCLEKSQSRKLSALRGEKNKTEFLRRRFCFWVFTSAAQIQDFWSSLAAARSGLRVCVCLWVCGPPPPASCECSKAQHNASQNSGLSRPKIRTSTF